MPPSYRDALGSICGDTDAIQIDEDPLPKRRIICTSLEGKARSEPETRPADPPAELDKVVTSPQDPHNPYFDSNLLEKIFAGASLELVFQAALLCKSLQDISRSLFFLERRARRYRVEPNSLAPLVFYEHIGKFYLMGYDSSDTNSWITSSPFPCSSKNIKSVAGHVGLLCVFEKGPNKPGTNFAYNPLTQNKRELPPMRFPRSPFVTNLHVTVAENQYHVIAIGSQASEICSRKTEIYDSKSNQWTEAAELPEGYLIDNQTGVYLEGCWYGTGSEGAYGRKVVMVLDRENLNWLDPIALPSPMGFLPTVQLLQCNGAVYLFSQDVRTHEITHSIYRLNPGSEGGCRWTKKVHFQFQKEHRFARFEYTCVPVKGKQGTKLGIFKNSCSVNVVTESVCRVYDITEDEAVITAASQLLPPRPLPPKMLLCFTPRILSDILSSQASLWTHDLSKRLDLPRAWVVRLCTNANQHVSTGIARLVFFGYILLRNRTATIVVQCVAREILCCLAVLD